MQEAAKMAISRSATIQCARCKRETVKENALAEGWIMVQKAAGPKGNLHVLCNLCRNRPQAAPMATLDVQEATPFVLAEREARLNKKKSPAKARPKRGKNASH